MVTTDRTSMNFNIACSSKKSECLMSKLATLDLMALFYFVITIEINANNNLSLTKITFQVFQFTTLVKDVEI